MRPVPGIRGKAALHIQYRTDDIAIEQPRADEVMGMRVGGVVEYSACICRLTFACLSLSRIDEGAIYTSLTRASS